MGHIALCMNSHSTTDSMEMQMAERSGSIPLFLYTTPSSGDGLQVPYSVGLTAESICHHAAQKCGITRLGSNLFAIYDDANKIWLSPAAVVTTSDVSLIFRFRFHMSRSTTNITSLEESVIAYMFAQFRYDFLQDKIGQITMEESLGLMVLDMVRYAYEKRVSIEHCLHRSYFKKFLPKSLARDLTMLDKWKLKKKIRKSLNEFDRCDQDVNSYRMMFLISLMEENQSWGVEEFETVNGHRYAVSIAAKGVTQITPADQAKHFKLLFEDVLNVGMIASRKEGSSNWIVLVTQREDTPKEFLVENKQLAESLVALIDGYYRLQVDYYHYLLPECAPPSLVQLIKSRCHGPIPLSCAKRKIEDAGSEDGIYLIRQNPEDFFSYCLTVRLDGRIKNYKIIITEDGSVGLPGQRTFPDVRAFVDYYRRSVNCGCLEGPLIKSVPVQPKEESLHMHDLSTLPEPPKQQPPDPPIEWIQQDNMSTKKRWKKLGGGQYTTVYRGEIKKRDKGWVQVAIKCPKKIATHQVQQKFSQSVDIMSSWSNQSVIKFLGIGAGFSLIMEFAPLGSMDTFLQKHTSTVKQSQQIAMAVQLIDALEYLESRRIIHGNISAHNALVVRSSPRVRVKLGDPMLSHYYHSLQITKKMNRVRWTAPELLCSNAEPTLESDRWSFGMTLWQIMALGQIPFEDKSDEEVQRLYLSSSYPPFPANSRADLNRLMECCWCPTPTDRFMCKRLLRDLNQIYMRFQEEDGADVLYWEVPDDDDGPEPIAEDLSEGEDVEDGDDSDSDEGMRNDPSWQVPSPFPPNGPITPSLDVVFPDLGRLEPLEDDSFLTTGRLITFSGIEKVANETLKVLQRIGSGNFGIVHRGEWMRSSLNTVPVAIKEITRNNDPTEVKQFEEEIRRMSKCIHKNIVKVLGYSEDGPQGKLLMVMEFVPFGALNSFLKNKQACNIPVGLSTMLMFAQQVAQGMVFLGNMQVVHRDLFARNVLVASDATATTVPEVKITDFGLARKHTTEGYYVTTGQAPMMPTLFYAIECIIHLRHSTSNCKFSYQSDVWTFGTLLWEIFSYGQSAQYPLGVEDANAENVISFLQDGKRLQQPVGCPPVMYSMMNECWRLKKHERPNFKSLVERIGAILESDQTH